jgi:hypothetical protein
MCLLRISAESSVILKEFSRNFSLSHEENAWKVPSLSQDRFISNPFRCIFHHSFCYSTLFSLRDWEHPRLSIGGCLTTTFQYRHYMASHGLEGIGKEAVVA